MSQMNVKAIDLSVFSTRFNFDFKNYFHVDTKLYRKLVISDTAREALDVAVALVMLLILAPVFAIVALLIKVLDKGPIFYSQVRVGKNGKLFNIYKFRTMIVDAEKKTGAVLATANDPRITPIGDFLRKSHLDELPQLLNVLKGDMAFIGPRPERPEFVEKFDAEIKNYTRRKEVKPGISGLAQVCLPYDATAGDKISFDVIFIDNRKYFLFSILIAFYTLKKMIYFKPFISTVVNK